MTYLLIFIFGASIGSFLNVIVCRLHSGEKIIWPRSHCPACRQVLNFFDLFPLISFLFLKARCRYCRKKISWQYPLVELGVGLLFVAAWLVEASGGGQTPGLIWFLVSRDWLFISFLTIIFVYDWNWSLILDIITIPAMVVVLLVNLLLGVSWLSLLIGALVGFGFFGLQYLISHGKWIGEGDLRLGALLGLMLGWQNIIVALFFAYIIGAVVAVILLLTKLKKKDSLVPFGTFLSIGGIIALFWGERIINWYLQLL